MVYVTVIRLSDLYDMVNSFPICFHRNLESSG